MELCINNDAHYVYHLINIYFIYKSSFTFSFYSQKHKLSVRYQMKFVSCLPSKFFASAQPQEDGRFDEQKPDTHHH